MARKRKEVAIYKSKSRKRKGIHAKTKSSKVKHSKNYKKHSHYDYASTHTFDEYVQALYNKTLQNDEHSSPQVNYIMYNGKIPCKHLLKFENLVYEIQEKLNLKVKNLKKINKSSYKDWRSFYTSLRTKNLVYEMYKKDFQYLNYNKNFN